MDTVEQHGGTMKGQLAVAGAAVTAGALLASVITGPAEATTSGQPHEARIMLGIGTANSPDQGWQPLGMVGGIAGSLPVDGTGTDIDPRNYPAGAVFRVKYNAGDVPGQSGSCVRLYDTTAAQAVTGSQHCLSVPANAWHPIAYYRWTSGPLQLAPGAHVYVVQIRTTLPSNGVRVSRSELVVNWTE